MNGRGEVAPNTADAQPVLLQCFEVRAAGDQVNVCSRQSEAAAKVTADSSGSEDRDAHQVRSRTDS
jgi:hypothetical protein